MRLFNWILSPPSDNNPPDDIKGFVIDEYKHNRNDLTVKGFGLWCKNRLGNFFYIGPISGNADNGVTLLDSGGEGLMIKTTAMEFYMDFHASVVGVRHMEIGDFVGIRIKNIWLHHGDNHENLLDITTTGRDRPHLNFHGDIQANGLSIDGDSKFVVIKSCIFRGSIIKFT